jgi:hypothetical protein
MKEVDAGRDRATPRDGDLRSAVQEEDQQGAGAIGSGRRRGRGGSWGVGKRYSAGAEAATKEEDCKESNK